MRDPQLVARAQRASARLESAWQQWRVRHGLAASPAQPVVSYVGYSLTEPWGEPRVVIGIDADEAEFLSDFLDRERCAGHGHGAVQPAAQRPGPQAAQVPLQPDPRQSGPLQQVKRAGQPEGAGEPAGLPLLRAPVAPGSAPRPPGQAGDMTAELAGWTSGELPGQATERLAGWQPGPAAGTDQPPGSA
jgi:hypothetical protein